MYCHGTKFGSSMYLTTKGPKDQIKPANKTTGIATFSFFNSNIFEYLKLIILDYNKNEFYLKILIFDPIEYKIKPIQTKVPCTENNAPL